MNISFEIADTMTATLAKTQHVEFDMTKLSQAGLIKVFEYGFQRIMNDAGAGSKTDDERLGAANKKYDALVSGVIRAARASGDPVAQEARKIATKVVTDAWKKREGHAPKTEAERAEVAELVKAYAAKPEVISKAKANVESVGELTIEL